jgi:multiple sugar transport system substrate-binding protein
MERKRFPQLTRRQMLKLTALATAGAFLAACGTPEPTEEPMVEEEEAPVDEVPEMKYEGVVETNYSVGEFSEELELKFEEMYPDVAVERVDGAAVLPRFAAGDPVDLIRIYAPALPQMLARNQILDLTTYFEASESLNPDDLLSANNYYRANSPLDVGSGKWYGCLKDWSPDNSIWIHTMYLEEEGLPIPSATEPMTYDELNEMVRQLLVKSGDRTERFGFQWISSFVDRTWENILQEEGKSLYQNEFSSINLTGDDQKAVLKYYYDLIEEGVTNGPLNPLPEGGMWNALGNGIVAASQNGYWYSAWLRQRDLNAEEMQLFPGPTWSGVRRNPTISGAGGVIARGVDDPDLAWRFFEYFFGEEPAMDRAVIGWGVPAKESLLAELPQETAWDQMCYTALQNELEYAGAVMTFNPFISDSLVQSTFYNYLEPTLLGDMTFDEMMATCEAEINAAIQEGIDRLAG